MLYDNQNGDPEQKSDLYKLDNQVGPVLESPDTF